jgi:hypothetical protein
MSALSVADRSFQQALANRQLLEGRKDLNLTDEYRVGWTEGEGLRELVQNMTDGVASTFDVCSADLRCVRTHDSPLNVHAGATRGARPETPERVSDGWDVFARDAYAGTIAAFDDDSGGSKVVLHQEKCVLSSDNLRMFSGKRQQQQGQQQGQSPAGGFGEGFKIGALVLLRAGWSVTYSMHSQVWRFVLRDNPKGGRDMFVEGERVAGDKHDSMTIVVNRAEQSRGGEGVMDDLFKRLETGQYVAYSALFWTPLGQLNSRLRLLFATERDATVYARYATAWSRSYEANIVSVAVCRELVAYDGVLVHSMSGARWSHEDVVRTMAAFDEWVHGDVVASQLERHAWLSEPLSTEPFNLWSVCTMTPEMWNQGEQLARALRLPSADEARVRCCTWRHQRYWLACLTCVCLVPVSCPASCFGCLTF